MKHHNKSLSINIISLLLGFFVANFLSTMPAQTGDSSIIAAAMIITFNEIISQIVYHYLHYSHPILHILKYTKVGIMYGLLVENNHSWFTHHILLYFIPSNLVTWFITLSNNPIICYAHYHVGCTVIEMLTGVHPWGTQFKTLPALTSCTLTAFPLEGIVYRSLRVFFSEKLSCPSIFSPQILTPSLNYATIWLRHC